MAHGEDGRISQNLSREQLARQVASGSWRGGVEELLSTRWADGGIYRDSRVVLLCAEAGALRQDGGQRAGRLCATGPAAVAWEGGLGINCNLLLSSPITFLSFLTEKTQWGASGGGTPWV